MKIAVVTPYWRESRQVIRRCLDSVRAQSSAATHYLVADGAPIELEPSRSLVHVVLPENIGNSGTTPRGIGTQLAFSDGFDVVALLDVDNWWDTDHLEKAVALLQRDSLDIVFARRTIVFPDGEVLRAPDPQEAGHVDTSCHVMSRRAAAMASVWALHPAEFGAGEERLALAAIQQLGLRTGRMDARTVWYESNWQHHYTLAGKAAVRPIRQPTRRVSTHFDPDLYFERTGITLPFARAECASTAPEKSLDAWRIAVVTAYQGESADSMAHQMASVAAQDVAATHLLVVDEARPAVEVPDGVRLLSLPGRRDDHGNTARAIGAMLAFQLGFDAVAFVDADTVLRRGHLRDVLDSITAQSSVVGLGEAPVVTRRAAYLGTLWAQLPRAANRADNLLLFERAVLERQAPVLRRNATPAAKMSASSAPGVKVAVVSPYFHESADILQRCVSTVNQQTLPATHYLVADGFPQALPAAFSGVHLVLPLNAGNYGATPRGLGAQLAFNDGCDAVAFLDADNWFDPVHLEQAVGLLEREQLDVVFARRRIVFPDGDVLGVADPKDAAHVDTNCYVVSKRAAFLAATWAMYPREFGSGEDRLVFAAIREARLRTAWLDAPTVWYESHWLHHYTLAGKQPVASTRSPSRRATTHFDPERYFQQTGIKLPFARAPDAEPVTRRPLANWQVAVVTASGAEPASVLDRCIASVASQGVAITHLLVGDDASILPDPRAGLIPFRLPGARKDSSNTARGLGAMYAFQLGFDAVAFLDGDAIFGPGQLQQLLSPLAQHHAGMAVSLPMDPQREPGACRIVLARRAAYLAGAWARLPSPARGRDGNLPFLQFAAERNVPTVWLNTQPG